MALDGFVIKSIVYELNNSIIDSRIDKIYQPESDEIILNIRGSRQNHQLLLSANSSYPRVTLTEEKFFNPQSPPSFCMFLRKHLSGGIIKKIIQISMDRIIMFEIEAKNELRTVEKRRIFIEIMGKHSNIIMTDDKGIVLECIKRISFHISSKRQLYPGIKYSLPNFEKKLNPLKLSQEIFISSLKKVNQGVTISSALVKLYYGMSPLLSREICSMAKINDYSFVGELKDENFYALYESFSKIISNSLNNIYSPSIYVDSSTKEFKDFHCFNLNHLINMNILSFESINQILNLFYKERALQHSYMQKTSELRKRVANLIDKNKKKYGILQIELQKSEDRQKYKTYGDLILANIYKISSDDTLLLAENYFSGDKVEISLDKRLTASQNAQKYFKKYNKLKIAEENLKTQIDLTIEHINYLENVLYSLENAIEPDIVEEIREELYKNEYIKKPSKLKTKAKNKKSHPLKIISKDGFEIYIGKNNNQNEYITFNIASKNDMWLHAKNMAGSHVIIKTNDREIPDSTLEEAASYAAYYSKGRNSEKVEVDYTLKYNVKKPSGSKPGYVIFHENYSLLIHPQKPEI